MILKSEIKYDDICKIHQEAEGEVTLTRDEKMLTVCDRESCLLFVGELEFEILGSDGGLRIFIRSETENELKCTHIVCKEGVKVK